MVNDRAPEASSVAFPERGHNRGPPLDDEHQPPWGDGIGTYFHWKAAVEKAWNDVSYDVAMFRMARAERLGLTYREYTLEILERGRYLQEEDRERIAEIKRARRRLDRHGNTDR